MYRTLIAACAAVVGFAWTAHGQEIPLLEITSLVCIGPGYEPDEDPFEILESIPPKSCERACKAAIKGCKAVVKSMDKCGVAYLKATAKVAMEVCRGLGLTKQQCKLVKEEVDLDIEAWLAEGKDEMANCDVEGDLLCTSRCRELSDR